MAEYLNPVSVSQMSVGPRDTSIPGAGWGPYEGFKQGQDRAMAQGLIGMSAQRQNMELEQLASKMQHQGQMNPLLREQQELQNLNLSSTVEGQNIENTEAMDERTMKHLGFVANQADRIADLESRALKISQDKGGDPDFTEARRAYNDIIERHKSMFGTSGLTLQDLNYEPGVTSQNLRSALEGVRYYDLKSAAEKGLQTQAISSKEKIAEERNVTSILTSLIAQDTQMAVAELNAETRELTKSTSMANLYERHAKILGKMDQQTSRPKSGQKVTDEEIAFINNFPEFVSRMAGHIQQQKAAYAGATAEEATAGELRGLGRGIQDMRNPQPQSPGNFQGPTPAPYQQGPAPGQPAPVQGPAPDVHGGPVPESLRRDPAWKDDAPVQSLGHKEKTRFKTNQGEVEVIFYKGDFARVRNPKTGQFGWVKKGLLK